MSMLDFRKSGPPLLIAAALAAPAMAKADCPTVTDLTSTGVLVTYADGARSQYRERSNGVVENDFYALGIKEGYWIDFLYGAYPLQSGVIVDGEIIKVQTEYIDYDQPPDGLKGPTADSYWASVATLLDGDRQPTRRARISVGAETFETFEIGSCVYDALPVNLLVDDSNDVMSFDYMYLDALGIAVLIGESYSGDSFPDRPEYEYEPISIEGQGVFSR